MTKASPSRMQRKLAMKQSNGKTTFKLTKADCDWYEKLALKEQLIRQQAQEQMNKNNLEVEDMMITISKREGVDFRLYNVDFAKRIATLDPGKVKLQKQKGDPNETAD